MDVLTVGGTAMNCETVNLFVYGSLQPGAWNHRLIERYVRRAVPGIVKGILVDLGSFPALVPGDGLVRGVMLTADARAMEITDRLEGVPHLYRRKEMTVTLTDGGQIAAWVYEYAEPARIAHRPRLLAGYDNNLPIFEWKPPLQ
jgi:gamma-glutamylcyclotransferase (GGCT)/AIG2-like uncharacterized protein YtfP